VLLCGRHHRQIHQPGWRLGWGADGALVVCPAGADGHPAAPLPTTPDRLTPQHGSHVDPRQVDLLIAILEQELAQTRGPELEQVA
jgi:hypothetical protein